MNDTNLRTYIRDKSIVFRKTNETYGGLSNMASGYPLCVNNRHILTSEALYQACRFPHLPDIQAEIIAQKSPMTAKMKSKPYRKQTREDWDTVRITIMKWCLRVKLLQNWDKFGHLLVSTGDLPIVEHSIRDPFWGAQEVDFNTLKGVNALGRLLMELRWELKNKKEDEDFVLPPPVINNFYLFGETLPVLEKKISNKNDTVKNGIVIKENVNRQLSIFDDL